MNGTLEDIDRQIAELHERRSYLLAERTIDPPAPPTAPIDEAVSEGWIRHDGGECPLPPNERVHFRTLDELRNPECFISEDSDGRPADTLRWTWKDFSADDPWNDNIVAYRAVPTSPLPKEQQP